MLLPLVIASGITLGVGAPDTAGRVVAAPHGGYDQETEEIARDVAGHLGWGRVTAIGYRSQPLRHWYDVNRPTERPWRFGEFDDARVTSDGRAVFEDYMRALARAARLRRGRLELLVEIHGHSRRVRTGYGSLRVEAIEVATRGFSRAALRRLQAAYQRLLQDLPRDLRVPLAFDRLDDRYEYDGWLIPFYFRASDAKRIGSLHPEATDHALHFELPRSVRTSWRARRAYGRLLAELIELADGEID